MDTLESAVLESKEDKIHLKRPSEQSNESAFQSFTKVSNSKIHTQSTMLVLNRALR